MRVTRCLVELQMLKNQFKLLHSAAVLAKCVKAKLWENSRYLEQFQRQSVATRPITQCRHMLINCRALVVGQMPTALTRGCI